MNYYKRNELQDNGREVIRTTIEYKGYSICEETRRSESGVNIKKLLSNDKELEFYCSLPVETDSKRLAAELERRLPQYLQEKDEFPLEYGAMMLDLGEPILPLYLGAKLEEYAMWSLTQDARVVEFLDRMMERLRIIYQWCLERDLADVYFLVGSEMASPPLVSEETFKRWIVPYAKELIEMVHCYGKKVIQHYHGQIKEILPAFVGMAPDGLHTIEAPPVGDCTFTEAFEIVGDKIVLIGNIQYDCFRSYTQKQMREAVKEVIDECKGKKFILSPTAGPFDEEVSDDVINNYLAFVQAGYDFGRF